MGSRTREVVARGLALPEGPRWHDGWLWFSDIHGAKVHRLDESGTVETVADVRRPEGLGFLPDGSLLVADEFVFRRIWPSGSESEDTIDLRSVVVDHAADMVIDGQGRAYVGDPALTFDQIFERGGTDPAGRVVLVPPDGPPRVVAGGLMVPNGICIMPDGVTLVVAECFGPMYLTAFTIAADGSLGERRTLAQIGTGAPDGICCDAEGGVWVAVHPRRGAFPHPSPPAVSSSGSEFIRILDGNIVDRIEVPDRWPLACALGGGDRRTLYMCTVEPPQPGDARSVKESHLEERSGQIDAVRVDVPGAGWP
ncbi:MAG TPA: SMP-30/gluconolactonase/LRE family protein [Acidimicrobiales bacterium]|jgi:sugar lactone lactonase YvrE|nr:SMP-30/gluconolactonase/LRE family protein [Acidimicrobiales bacterium]